VVDSGGSSRFYHKIGLYRDRRKEPMTAYNEDIIPATPPFLAPKKSIQG
jgi:hypothetical protein